VPIGKEVLECNVGLVAIGRCEHAMTHADNTNAYVLNYPSPHGRNSTIYHTHRQTDRQTTQGHSLQESVSAIANTLTIANQSIRSLLYSFEHAALPIYTIQIHRNVAHRPTVLKGI